MTTWMRTGAALVVVAVGCRRTANDAVPVAEQRVAPAAPAPAPTTSVIAAPSGAPVGAAAPPPGPAKDGCHVVGRLSSERHNMAVVALPDGRVLFVGGGLHDQADPRAEVDAYDPRTNAVTRFATLVHGRILPGAAVLADGRVVVVGGVTDEGQPGRSIEVYEPATRAFRVVPAALDFSVESPFAIPMKDGRVLMGGGIDYMRHSYRPLDVYLFDAKTGKLAPARDSPWPLEAKSFYTVAASGAITVVGSGPVGAAGMPERDCETIFDPASGAWTDTRRCHDLLSWGTRYPAANGAPGAAGCFSDGLKAYRHGAWETVMTAPYKATGAALFDGITLDAHHAVASDGFTHEVVSCTF
jgi:hypothetical protein